jgi:hypothetical protein
MTDTPVKIVIDLSKPEGEREQIIPLTAEEIAKLEADAVEEAKQQAERDAIEQAKIATKESAIAKLEALGLTEDEAKAIIG